MEATQEKEKMPTWMQVVYEKEFKKNVRRIRAGKIVTWEFMKDELAPFVDFDFTFFSWENGYIFVQKKDHHHKAFLADLLDEIRKNGRVSESSMIGMYSEYVDYTNDRSGSPFQEDIDDLEEIDNDQL